MAGKNQLSEQLIKQKLCDRSVKYQDKIPFLSNGWSLLKELSSKKNPGNVSLEEFAQFVMGKSIHLVLRLEWQSLAKVAKLHVKSQMTQCRDNFKKLSDELASKCNSILRLMEDPWGNAILKDLMQEKPYQDSAVLKFFEEERHILRFRLMTLCEEKACFDLAHRIAAVVWKFCKQDRASLFFISDDDINFVLDLLLVLLMRQNMHGEIINQMKNLPIHLGLQCVQRLKGHHHHPPDRSKLWKKSLKAATIVVQLFATRAMKESIEGKASILDELLTEFIEICHTNVEFKDILRKLGAQALSVEHITALSKCLQKKFGDKHRLSCIEMYVKVMTNEVNHIQHLKTLENEKDLRTAQEHLSQGFLSLSELLSENVLECRECVLTSFSLNPTADCLERLDQLAVDSAKVKIEVLDTGQVNDPVKNENVNAVTVPQEMKIQDSISTDQSSFHLPANLKDDLYVIFNCPRNRSLSWQLEWSDLKQKCEAYLQEVLGGKGLATKELKYLDLDYSMFENLPVNEDENHDGIEKGYEVDTDSSSSGRDGKYEYEEDLCSPDHASTPSEAGSDKSYTIKKKPKYPESLESRKKKTKTPKRTYPSTDDYKSRLSISENLIKKVKNNQRKPKGKTPKSDAKRNGKSSVVQFAVSSVKDPRSSGVSCPDLMGAMRSNFTSAGNYHNINPEDLMLSPPDKKGPRNMENLSALRQYRLHKQKAKERGEPAAKRMAPRDPYSLDEFDDDELDVPGLNSLDMLVPGKQCTTVQVVHVSGNATRQPKPDEEQVNGKPAQGGTGSGSSGGHSAGASSQPPKLVESLGGPRTGLTVTASAASSGSGHQPVQLPMQAMPPLTSQRVLTRRDREVPTPALAQRSWATSAASTTTALPQFSQAFGSGRDSALKQALLADKQTKPSAAGFGSQTRPAGFGAPGNPLASGFGPQSTQQQQRLPLTTTPSPCSSAQPQEPPPLQQGSMLQQQQPQQALLAVSAAPQAGIPTSATVSTTTQAQVIVKTSSGTATIVGKMATTIGASNLNQTSQPGLLLAVGTSSNPTLLHSASSTVTASISSGSATASSSSSPGPGLLQLQAGPSLPTRCVPSGAATVTTTKAGGATAAVLVAGLSAPSGPPLVPLPSSLPVPTLVPRTHSFPSSSGEVQRLQIVQAVGQPGQANQAVKVSMVPATSVPVPALVQTSAAQQHATQALSAVASPPGVTAVTVAKRPAGVTPVPTRLRVSNPILNKYLRQTAQDGGATIAVVTTAATPPATPPATPTASTSTTPPGAAAAAAAATAAARAEAANAPTNMSRPLYSPTTPTAAVSENDILKAQLLEFESVLHHVNMTRQLKERQSLTEDEPPKPSPASTPSPASATVTSAPALTSASTPPQPQTPIAAPAPSPAAAATPVSTPTTPTAVAAPTPLATPTGPTTLAATPPSQRQDLCIQAGPADPPAPPPPPPPPPTALRLITVSQVSAPSATQPSVQATTQTVLGKATLAVTTIPTVSTSFTQTPLTPKKKAKMNKTLTVLTATGVSPVLPVVPAIVIPTIAPATTTTAVTATTTTTTTTTTSVGVQHGEPRSFKPSALLQISASNKHNLNTKITEDEETTARILSILRQYDEQLRCSPEINNKPAPRRRNQVTGGATPTSTTSTPVPGSTPGSGSGSGAGSSPTSKRKSKSKSKGGSAEMSPGTEESHTMGSEDSSIASHFADGVLEATPTSPLSTCDDRSVASSAITTVEATSSLTTTFTGVTKSSSLTSETVDPQPSSGTSEIQGYKMHGSPIKVQCLTKAPPSAKLTSVAKASLPSSKASSLSKAQVPSKSPSKAGATQKVQMLAKAPTSKVQPVSKARASLKVQTGSKVQQLLPEITVTHSRPAASLPGTNIVSVKEEPSETSMSLQSVEPVKTSFSLEPEVGNTTQISSQVQLTEQSPQSAPVSPQVSQLERALQSKPISSTPLLARALKTPATPLPTTFAGILNTTTRLSIAQPSSTVQLRPLSKSANVQLFTLNRQKVQAPDADTSNNAPVPNLLVGNLKSEEASPAILTSAPTSISQSQQIFTSPVSLNILQQAQALQVQQHTGTFKETLEAVSTSQSSAASQPSLALQQISTVPVTLLPSVQSSCTDTESLTDVQVLSAAVDEEVGQQTLQTDLISAPHEQSTSVMVLPARKEVTVDSTIQTDSDVLPHTSILHPVAQQPNLEEGLQEAQKSHQIIGDVPQAPSQVSVQLMSATQMTSQTLRSGQPAPKEHLTAKLSQPLPEVLSSPTSSITGIRSPLQAQLSSHIVPPETQTELIQPTLSVEQATDVGQSISQILQPITTGQLTSQVPQGVSQEHISSQIVEPVPQAQLVHPIAQEQMLQPAQISTEVSSPSSIVQNVAQGAPVSQIVIPTNSQIVQTSSLVESSPLTQIIHASPQVMQSISQSSVPHLVQTSKTPQQRFGLQPLQITSTSAAPQLRRLVQQVQVPGECAPQLVQISQPSLIQSVQSPQLQSTQPVLLPSASQAVSVALTSPISYSQQKQTDADGIKVPSPSKQNVMPLYMVPSTSASSLPVVFSSAGSLVQVNLVNSQAGPLVLRQFPKQEGKSDGSHDTYVISCDSSQPLLLSTTFQQLLSGNSPVVSSGPLGTALSANSATVMAPSSTATVMASSNPSYSVTNVVDSSVATDTSVLSLSSHEVPVSVNTMISNPVSQIYSSLTSPTAVVSTTAPVEVPAPVGQSVPRAITPSNVSSITSPAKTSPSSTPARPTTLLALQKSNQLAQLQQLRKKQVHQQEEDAKLLEIQKIQQLRRLSVQQQQIQPDTAAQATTSQELQPVITSQSQPQQLPPGTMLVSQLESKRSPTKPFLRVQVLPQKPREEVEKMPVIIPRTKNRPTMSSNPPQYRKTEPTQLKQLLEQTPAPLPPLYPTIARRLSDPGPTPMNSFPLSFNSAPKTQENVRKTIIDKESPLSGNTETKTMMESAITSGLQSPPLQLLPASTTTVTDASSNVLRSQSLSPHFKLPTMLGQENAVGSVGLQSSTQSLSEILSRPLPEALPSTNALPSSKSENLSSGPDLPVKTPLAPHTGVHAASDHSLSSSSPERALALETILLKASPEKQLLTPEKSQCLLSAEKSATEIVTPTLIPLRLPPTPSPERQAPQVIPQISGELSQKLTSPKGKKSPKIYAVLKTPPFKASTKVQQKLTSLKSTPKAVTSMIFSHRGLETFPSVSDTVAATQQEGSESLPLGTAISRPDIDVTADNVARDSSVKRLSEEILPQHTQPPRLNILTKFTSQSLPQKTHLPVSDAPPLAPVSTSKPVELASLDLDDASLNTKGLLSGLPANLYSDLKPMNSSEVRVYSSPAGETSRLSDPSKVKPSTSAQVTVPLNVPAPPLVLTSVPVATSSFSSNNGTASAKGRSSVPATYSGQKSSPKIQTSTQSRVQVLTTFPLQVHKPATENAQVVLQQPQMLQSPGMLKLQPTASPAITVHQHTMPVHSDDQQEDIPATIPQVTPRPKRVRNRKKSPHPSKQQDTIKVQSSIGPDKVPHLQKTPSPVKSSDSEASPSKRSNKKKDLTGVKPINPELVSQHLSDAIMRVSLGADAVDNTTDGLETPFKEEAEVTDVSDDVPEGTAEENFNSLNDTLAKDVYYEGQEKIPVEVAVAALCGEDIEIAQDLIEGNLQVDMKRRGSITLLPADPSDNAEELNFSFKNVIQAASEENLLSVVPESSSTSDVCDLPPLEENRHSSIVSALKIEGESSDAADINSSSMLTKEIDPMMDKQEDDSEVTSTRAALKRKAASQTGSFSEHSRSLSGSEDLSMDKTSTSDIFPESDLLFETTLSPSFLGEIQLSPTNSQDAVCASPEPPDKKKRCLVVKSGATNKVQSSAPDSFCDAVPKLEEEECKDAVVNKPSSSIDSLYPFNGGTERSTMIIEDTFQNTLLKQEPNYLDSDLIENPQSNANSTLNALAGTSTVSAFFSSVKRETGSADGSITSVDEAPWEKEPLFSIPSQSPDHDEEFWGQTLTSGVEINLNQEADTNSSSTPSESVSRGAKSLARSTRRSSTPQARKESLKRKDESSESPSRKQSGEKRKRVGTPAPSMDEDDTSKYVSSLRSASANRREGGKSSALKEECQTVVPRRVSSRTHKPVTKYDEPQKKGKSMKQTSKAVAQKRK